MRTIILMCILLFRLKMFSFDAYVNRFDALLYRKWLDDVHRQNKTNEETKTKHKHPPTTLGSTIKDKDTTAIQNYDRLHAKASSFQRKSERMTR